MVLATHHMTRQWTANFTAPNRTGAATHPALHSDVIGQQHSMVQGGALIYGRMGPSLDGWGVA